MKYLIKFILIGLILLLSGCASVDRGNFGYFKRSLNNKSYGYKISEDITKTAPTKNIEIFEVRNGDCSFNKGWSDCKKDRERSELSGKKDNYRESEYWYGWSIYFPNNYTNIYPTKVALGQFHQKSSHPVWMFQNSSGGYHLDQQVHGRTERYYKLLDDKELRGKWNKIKLHVKWSTTNNGFFRAWVNGVKKVDYSGQTMTASQVYFKYGVYRSFMSRYKGYKQVDANMDLIIKRKENPNKVFEEVQIKVPTQIVYYSNVKRANTEDGLTPENK